MKTDHVSKKKWKNYMPNTKIGWMSLVLLLALIITTILGSTTIAFAAEVDTTVEIQNTSDEQQDQLGDELTETDDSLDVQIAPNSTPLPEQQPQLENPLEEQPEQQSPVVNQDPNRVTEGTNIKTYNGYEVSVISSVGVTAIAREDTGRMDDHVIFTATLSGDLFQWDGWYIDGIKVSSDMVYEFNVSKNQLIVEAKAKPKKTNLMIFTYKTEGLFGIFSGILNLGHSPKEWNNIGTAELTAEQVAEIQACGLKAKKQDKVLSTDMIYNNAGFQQILSNAGINYANYEWRFVWQDDGIHLDGVQKNIGFDENVEPNPGSETEDTPGMSTIYAEAQFAIDGIYHEWTNYPHTVVEYNAWDGIDDALSAVYKGNNFTFFHVYTEMPAHLDEKGGAFTAGISVLFNDDWTTAFYPRFITVDDAGNINWNPQLNGLNPGLYHFYIVSTDAWATSTNINDLNDMDQIYGDAYIRITGTRDEIEYALDMSKIAKKFGMDKSEFKTVSVTYSRLGPQATISAGTSTGGVFGIVVTMFGLACFCGIVCTFKNLRQAAKAKKNEGIE